MKLQMTVVAPYRITIKHGGAMVLWPPCRNNAGRVYSNLIIGYYQGQSIKTDCPWATTNRINAVERYCLQSRDILDMPTVTVKGIQSTVLISFIDAQIRRKPPPDLPTGWGHEGKRTLLRYKGGPERAYW